jgi:hypothetical protein
MLRKFDCMSGIPLERIHTLKRIYTRDSTASFLPIQILIDIPRNTIEVYDS